MTRRAPVPIVVCVVANAGQRVWSYFTSTGVWAMPGERAPIGVVEGDEVLFGKYSGTDIKVDNQDHVILREDEILGIVEV